MTLSFGSLPAEVLRSVISYMDIPSLAAVSATHRAEADNIAALAADDETWYSLLQRRFGIGRNHRSARRKKEGVVLVQRDSSPSLSSSGRRSDVKGQRRGRRPSTYGGVTWKDAYRCLSSTMRVPETRLTSGSHNKGRGGATFASPHLHGRHAKNSVADFLGVWCMIHHTENCRTKTVTDQIGRRRRRDDQDTANVPLPYRLDRRYVELKLCLQNTKSGFGRVAIPDISAIRIATLDEEEYFSAWGWDKWDADYDATFRLVQEGPWAPKLLLQRGPDDDAGDRDRGATAVAPLQDVCRGARDLLLRPFEVAVLSVHVSCPAGHVYETDVLASAASVRVPVVADGWPPGDGGGGERCRRARSRVERAAVRRRDVAVSRFMSEDGVWDHFALLPGGCLSLTDRSRLVPV